MISINTDSFIPPPDEVSISNKTIIYAKSEGQNVNVPYKLNIVT